MLFVPNPVPIQRHPGSDVFIPSSLCQTPPPAAPTHRRHAPLPLHAGEIASAETRPEKLPDPLAPPALVDDGPRLIQALPCACAPRYATPRKTQYFAVAAWKTVSESGVPG